MHTIAYVLVRQHPYRRAVLQPSSKSHACHPAHHCMRLNVATLDHAKNAPQCDRVIAQNVFQDPNYYVEVASGGIYPIKTWCFFAEIVDDSLSQVGRGSRGVMSCVGVAMGPMDTNSRNGLSCLHAECGVNASHWCRALWLGFSACSCCAELWGVGGLVGCGCCCCCGAGWPKRQPCSCAT